MASGVAETGPGSTGPGSTGGSCAVDGMEDACMLCLKTNCCAELTACIADPACSCTQECLGSGGDPPSCETMCGSSDTFLDVVSCGEGPCPECGSGTPGPCDTLAGDGACFQCLAGTCCMELEACAGAFDCACMGSCLRMPNATVASCAADCGVDLANPSPEIQALVGCTSSAACQDEDGNACSP
jgi:hypothetical protein